MSPRTFTNLKDYRDDRYCPQAHRIDHKRIEFEITETTAMKDVHQMPATMQQFHRRGMRFAIDAFGTDGSSRNNRCQMPMSIVQIDKRYPRAEGAKRYGIVSAITAISPQMQHTMVVKGVAMNCRIQWPRRIGCNEVRGFCSSRPAPEQDTPHALRFGGKPAAPPDAAVFDTTRITI